MREALQVSALQPALRVKFETLLAHAQPNHLRMWQCQYTSDCFSETCLLSLLSNISAERQPSGLVTRSADAALTTGVRSLKVAYDTATAARALFTGELEALSAFGTKRYTRQALQVGMCGDRQAAETVIVHRDLHSMLVQMWGLLAPDLIRNCPMLQLFIQIRCLACPADSRGAQWWQGVLSCVAASGMVVTTI